MGHSKKLWSDIPEGKEVTHSGQHPRQSSLPGCLPSSPLIRDQAAPPLFNLPGSSQPNGITRQDYPTPPQDAGGNDTTGSRTFLTPGAHSIHHSRSLSTMSTMSSYPASAATTPYVNVNLPLRGQQSAQSPPSLRIPVIQGELSPVRSHHSSYAPSALSFDSGYSAVEGNMETELSRQKASFRPSAPLRSRAGDILTSILGRQRNQLRS